jgi:membrane protein implicated in regulation of membrane protease activity
VKRDSKNERAYLWMTVGTLLVVGGGLIVLIFDAASLLSALPLLLAGAVLILLLWWLVSFIANWRERSERKLQERAEQHVARLVEKESGAKDETESSRR